MSYTPGLFPPAAEKYIAGTLLQTLGGSFGTLAYTSSHADTTLAATPGTSSWTILKTGFYVVSAWLADVPSGAEALNVEIVVNGSQVATGNGHVNGAEPIVVATAMWHGSVTAGQVVSVQGSSSAGLSANGAVLIEFVPTAANPQ